MEKIYIIANKKISGRLIANIDIFGVSFLERAIITATRLKPKKIYIVSNTNLNIKKFYKFRNFDFEYEYIKEIDKPGIKIYAHYLYDFHKISGSAEEAAGF